MEHSVDGMLAGDVLNLAATEVVGRGKRGGIGGGELGYHLLPNEAAYRGVGLAELYLVEEAALEGGVEIVGEIGGSDEDAVERLHLLEDDILYGVLHLIYRIGGTIFAYANDGICLVEEKDGRHFGAVHQFAVAVEEGFDVFLGVAHPLALDLRNIDHQNIAPRLSCQLIDGLGFACARPSVEEA